MDYRVRVMGFGRRTFASLRHRDFALLWSGTVVMGAGTWLQQVTLSWLLFQMTGSALLLGLLNALQFLPFLFTSLIGGVLADRMDRRRLMIGAQLYVLCATAVMAVLLLSGRAEPLHLFVFTFLAGIGWSLTMPVRQSLVPALVPRADLHNAVALTSTAFNLTRTVGPAIGGILLVTLGGAGTFLAQVVFYAVVLVMLGAMRVPAVPATAAARQVKAWRSVQQGLGYVRGSPAVGSLLLLGLAPFLLGMPYQSLLPVFAADVYNIGASGLGLLIASAGMGSLLATLAVAGAGDFHRKGLVQLVALGALGVSLTLYGQMVSLPLAVLTLLCVGAALMTYSTVNMTQLQMVVADDMRGRVMSLYLLSVGLVPAGSFAAGLLAEAIGAPAVVSTMGLLIVAVTAIAALRARRDSPAPVALPGA